LAAVGFFFAPISSHRGFNFSPWKFVEISTLGTTCSRSGKSPEKDEDFRGVSLKSPDYPLISFPMWTGPAVRGQKRAPGSIIRRFSSAFKGRRFKSYGHKVSEQI
jgi:hypothetical protein